MIFEIQSNLVILKIFFINYQLQKMKALIIGATGATGKDLLQQLIDDTHFSEIHVFGRRALELRNNKVFEHIVDFDQPETWKDLVTGDVAFSCLGTTLKDAGSKEAQRKVDFD